MKAHFQGQNSKENAANFTSDLENVLTVFYSYGTLVHKSKWEFSLEMCNFPGDSKPYASVPIQIVCFITGL